jgi:hypothetical protein
MSTRVVQPDVPGLQALVDRTDTARDSRMYEFICKHCGRRYYSASSTGGQDRCEVCGGELAPTGVQGSSTNVPSDDCYGSPATASRSEAPEAVGLSNQGL